MTDRGKIRRIAYLALWALFLAFVELTYDPTETSDSEAIRSILFATVAVLALPASLIFVAAWMAIGMLLQLFDASPLDWLNGSIFASKEWFRLQFFLWWLLLLAASYWQWFHLLPSIVSVVKRRASQSRATRS